MTSKLSTLLSRRRKSLDRAMNLHKTKKYVEIFVNFPLNKLCCRSHLSVKIFNPILFSMEKEDRKSIMLLSFCIHSPFSNGLFLSVFMFINLAYIKTNDWITLGVLERKTFKTTSYKIDWSGFSINFSKVKIVRFPTYTEAASNALSEGILRREWIASMTLPSKDAYLIKTLLFRTMFFKQIVADTWTWISSLFWIVLVRRGRISTIFLPNYGF